MSAKKAKKAAKGGSSGGQGLLNTIEKVGNKVPHPVLMFLSPFRRPAGFGKVTELIR